MKDPPNRQFSLIPSNRAVESPFDEPREVAAARRVLRRRQLRASHFSASWFREPAWEMLVILFVREQAIGAMPTSRLIDEAGASAATGLRWLDVLEGEKLIERWRHPTDGRQRLVRLTPLGREKLQAYFAEAEV
jgi:DNA-binding MarR family transcriptional regulator